MTSPLPTSAPAEDIQAYTHTTARLLESVASASNLVEWSDHLRELLKLLSDISTLLVSYGAVRNHIRIIMCLADRCVGLSFDSAI